MKPPIDDTEKDSSFRESYQKDKRRGAFMYIVMGFIFAIWTVFDVIYAFFEDMWYYNVFFGLLAASFIIFGVIQLKAYPKNRK